MGREAPRGPTIPAVGLHHFAADVDPGEVSDHLRRFGYAIVDEVADPALLDCLKAEGHALYRGLCRGARRIRRPVHPANRRAGGPLPVGPAPGHASAGGPDGRALPRPRHHRAAAPHPDHLSVEPGETAQKLHRDEMAFDFFDFGPDYHVQCNTMWALSDFTAGNGATWILPGTSGLDDEAAAAVAGAQAEMSRGSVLFYEGKVLHGAGGQHLGRRAPGRQHHLRSGLGAPGGEPVPGLPARDRPHPRRRPAAHDGLHAGAPSPSDTWATRPIPWPRCGAARPRPRPSVRLPSTTSTARHFVADIADTPGSG